MLSEKLKEYTKNNHQILEKKLVARMRAMASKTDYAKLLALFYSFFGGMELTIDKYLDFSLLPDYPFRRKSRALADDMIALEIKQPALAPYNSLPTIHNHRQAAGALYVIEGSTLGGKIICKMIRQQLNIPDLVALSFFNGYGDQTESMWHTFKLFIDRPEEVAGEDEIIDAANQTFIKFSQWFDVCGL